MTFIRPELRAALWRWREVALAAVLCLEGLRWILGGYGLQVWIGVALLAGGVALGIGAVQRLRFRRGGGGAGVVQIDERRIAYFGPLTGGILDLDDLSVLALDGTGRPAHWQLTGADGTVLSIPVDAEGADALFDAFTALPGLRTEPLLAALAARDASVVRLWTRQAPTALRLAGR